ncbi:PrsW family glutamic-type intramembrane protease [Actinomycetospora sp. C-140]
MTVTPAAPRHHAPAPSSALPDLATLIPWRAWLHHPALRTGPVALVVALVVVPPLGLLLAEGHHLEPAVVLFAAYFAAAWWLLFRSVLRPVTPGPAVAGSLVLLALFTQGPLAYALEEALDADTKNLIAGIFTVGVPEELVKALPVAVVVLWLRSQGRFMEPRDVLFLGVVSGLVFGAAEAIHYVLDYYSGVSGRVEALEMLWRLTYNPAIHGAWAGITAYFLGLAARRDPSQWAALAGLGLGIAAVLHGFSNWVSGTWLWIVVAGVSALLLLAYSTVGVPSGQVPPPVRAEPDPPTAPIVFRGPDGRWWA